MTGSGDERNGGEAEPDAESASAEGSTPASESAPELEAASELESESDAGSGATERCDYCRHPIPLEPVSETVGGIEYSFCSESCREALAETGQVFTTYHGFRYLRPGVGGLDGKLPQGLPRNSFVLLSGQVGTRTRSLGLELVWRRLRRGEPAVVLCFAEPPGAVVQQFLDLAWNVLPYLERDRLHLIDCFTYRAEDRDRTFDRLNRWNRHLYGIAEDATTTVRDPTDTGALTNTIDGALEELGMTDEGIVLIDSLTELGSLLQPVRAYDLVKGLRADVCKGRFVPIFACAFRRSEEVAFPHDLEYLVDGVVDLRLNGSIVEDTLIKQFRVRKLNGALAIAEWTAYEYTAEDGLVPFDPVREMDEADGEPAGTQVTIDEATEGGAERSGEASTEGGAGPDGTPGDRTDPEDGPTDPGDVSADEEGPGEGERE